MPLELRKARAQPPVRRQVYLSDGGDKGHPRSGNSSPKHKDPILLPLVTRRILRARSTTLHSRLGRTRRTTANHICSSPMTCQDRPTRRLRENRIRTTSDRSDNLVLESFPLLNAAQSLLRTCGGSSEQYCSRWTTTHLDNRKFLVHPVARILMHSTGSAHHVRNGYARGSSLKPPARMYERTTAHSTPTNCIYE
ncbi:hypothetical protein CERZMDRAFT_89635 [Cercospora zeae-maydis SCOH1-5]|uniref:Uncharacterized protein n=1 Tax=Cercospora zeae-maydis SCOH1-5 TaxID=717836 RepID=A0A6A6FWN8_9PEZI|nr:hypothetical protein CERZMDRAFT_89635 [Cercospora zeae-maydis SCOH1-5]